MSKTKAYFFISLVFSMSLVLANVLDALHAWNSPPYRSDGNFFVSVLGGLLAVVLTTITIGAFLSAIGVFLFFVFGAVLALKERDAFVYIGIALNAAFVTIILYSI